MIQPSQQSSRRRESDPFKLHSNFARKRYWHLRLFFCSAGAALLSIIAYLLGVGWLWHTLFIALGLALGFVLPIKKVNDWALGFIEGQIGLSYRTAVEYKEADPYGFQQAVTSRAARYSRNVAKPQLQPWWLPLVMLALILMILPKLDFTSSVSSLGRLPNNPLTPQSTPPPATPDPADSEEVEQDEEPVQEQAEEESIDEAIEDSTVPDSSESFDSPSNSSSQAQGNRMVDSETLDRFLENLSELPPEREEERPEGSAPDRQQGAEGNPEQQSQADRLEQGQGEQGEQGEAGQEGQQQQGQEGDQGEQGEQQGQPPESGEDGQEQGDSAGSDQESGESASDGQEESPQGSSEANGDEGLQDASEGEPGDAAGNSPSAAIPSDVLEQANENDPELLEGRLQSGPTTVAGEVRMPGSQELELASGSVREDYDQALEQAVSEGRIPVEYQEILRNYFR